MSESGGLGHRLTGGGVRLSNVNLIAPTTPHLATTQELLHVAAQSPALLF